MITRVRHQLRGNLIFASTYINKIQRSHHHKSSLHILAVSIFYPHCMEFRPPQLKVKPRARQAMSIVHVFISSPLTILTRPERQLSDRIVSFLLLTPDRPESFSPIGCPNNNPPLSYWISLLPLANEGGGGTRKWNMLTHQASLY